MTTATKGEAKPRTMPSRPPVVPNQPSPGQDRPDAQNVRAGGDLEHLDGGQCGHEAQLVFAPVEPSPGHSRTEAQPSGAGGDLPALPATNSHSKPMLPTSPADLLPPDQASSESHEPRVGGEEHVRGQDSHEAQRRIAADVFLKLAAESLNDIEGTRIATALRIAAWDRPPEKSGLGLPTDIPEYGRLVAIHDALKAAEKLATAEVQRQMRRHPHGPFVKASMGVGFKQGARLIAAIGDPYWNSAEDRARRGPAELWAYCGYHLLPRDQVRPEAHELCVPGGNVIAKRRKGIKNNWSAEAKMRARLVAESTENHRCKACRAASDGPAWSAPPADCTCEQDGYRYRAVYDKARVKHAEAVHGEPCAQCGPKGKPAPAGSPLSDGHKRARALREVAKEVLKDLYLDAKALHETPPAGVPS